MLIKLSRRPIKSRFYAVDNEGNVICEGGDYLYVETKLRDILSDDEIEKREIEIINDEIESSRRPIKSSFVIEHWNPLLPQTQYVGYNDEGLAGVYDINDALQFNTKEEAKQFIKEHDEEYGGKLKIHEYPSYVQNSRRPVESSFIVGKQDNGNKVYFCEDGLYYSENDYARPSIKIFDNKREADKIAKRSKSGFVIPLEK